uniref:Uncharacterized protein n=1 Tax=Arundo donax TaxID=35708 RepID=A0A0A8YLH3_ARUDO
MSFSLTPLNDPSLDSTFFCLIFSETTLVSLLMKVIFPLSVKVPLPRNQFWVRPLGQYCSHGFGRPSLANIASSASHSEILPSYPVVPRWWLYLFFCRSFLYFSLFVLNSSVLFILTNSSQSSFFIYL